MTESEGRKRQVNVLRKGSYGIDATYLLAVPVLLIVVNIVNGVVFTHL